MGRGYVGKSLGLYNGFDLVSHTDVVDADLSEYDAVVNAAGIIGHQRCDEAGYDAVINANVSFPVRLYRSCYSASTPFIQLTTTGISEVQIALSSDVGFGLNDPIYPHNLYCASKVLLESLLSGKKWCFMLRMPWVFIKGVFENRIRGWTHIQDTYTSVLDIDDLVLAIRKVVDSVPTGFQSIYSDIQFPSGHGTYHVKSRDVYFPEFINGLLDTDLQVKSGHPRDMTAAIPITDNLLLISKDESCPICHHYHPVDSNCLD